MRLLRKKYFQVFQVSVVLLGLSGIICYFYVVPGLIRILALFTSLDQPDGCKWFFFLLGSGIPCYMVLVEAWGFAADVKRGKGYSQKSILRLRKVSVLSAADAIFLVLGNGAFMAAGKNSIFMFVSLLLITVAGICLSLFFTFAADEMSEVIRLRNEMDLVI